MKRLEIPELPGIQPLGEYHFTAEPVPRALGKLTSYNWETFKLAYTAAQKAGVTDNEALTGAVSYGELVARSTQLTNLLAKQFGVSERVFSTGMRLRIFASHVNPPTEKGMVLDYQTLAYMGEQRVATTFLKVVAHAGFGFVNLQGMAGGPLEGNGNAVAVPGVIAALRHDAKAFRRQHVGYFRTYHPPKS